MTRRGRHELATGVQTVPAGIFCYAKSASHASDTLIPQHGTKNVEEFKSDPQSFAQKLTTEAPTDLECTGGRRERVTST